MRSQDETVDQARAMLLYIEALVYNLLAGVF